MSTPTYAQVRGKTVPSAPKAPERPRAPKPLTAAEQDRAAEMAALHKQHLPEFNPMLKELHELGMIDGWRSIVSIEVLEEPKNEPENLG